MKANLEKQVCAIESENNILRTENEMYEQKIKEIEDERQQMYFVMFKKGQQAVTHMNAEVS